MDHAHAPILQALESYRKEQHLSFIPPGHKQGRAVDPRVLEVMGRNVFASDIILMNGLDDRRLSNNILVHAEELMAEAVHADKAFFSTCGSSLSVKTCLITVAGPHETLLVSRNAHKSVVAGLIISGIQPIWVHPRWDNEWELAHPPGPDSVAEALRRDPSAKGMLLITPTDYGSCAAIAETAKICHQHDRPLIVDEAWGAHFPFHPALPSWAMDAGADLCVTSVHKMGAGLEQGSVYHLQGDRIDERVLAARADLLNTTSPSVLIYAALDGWRRQMVEHGHNLLDKALVLAKETRKRLQELSGIRVMELADFVGLTKADNQDSLKIVLDLNELGISGYTASEWLRENQKVNVGLADHRRFVVQLTIADSEQTAERLISALQSLVKRCDQLPKAKPVEIPNSGELELEQAKLPRDAFFGLAEQVDTKNAVGRIAAETISPYPPGVPAILPGEVITQPVIDYLLSGLAAGMYLPDAADSSLETIRVSVD